MSAGRTTWWARDAAQHDRELVVELGDQFGPAGPYVLTVLYDMAQQQRDEGCVFTGFKVLSRKAFCTPEEVRAIVTEAAVLGALDDLVVQDDGRRFTCRVSGWTADQARGKQSFKKAAQRARDEEGQEGDMSPFGGDKVTAKEDVSPPRPPTRPNQTITSSSETAEKAVSPEVDRLCRLLADLILERDPKAKVAPSSAAWVGPMDKLMRLDGRSPEDVERVVRWCQADSFWQSNILSPNKLREKFTALNAKAPVGRRLSVVSEVELAEHRNRLAAERMA